MTSVRLGLRANLAQFTLLVVVNGFVGAMIGIERAILPALAGAELHVAARAAILSFIVVFGVTKALSNYVAGRWADRVGRKRVLVVGWLVAAPVPFLLMWAPTWTWVLIANALLGVSQGLTWSTTVIMKIDLVGPARRGLAMGLNRMRAVEFSFLLAVPTMVAATGYDLFKQRAHLNAAHLDLLAVGGLVAFACALLAVRFFVGFISKRGFFLFGIYRIVVGIIFLAVFWGRGFTAG